MVEIWFWGQEVDTILKRRNTLAFDATVKGKFKLTVRTDGKPQIIFNL